MAVMKGEGRTDIIYGNLSVTGRADEFDAWFTRPDRLGRSAAVVVVPDVWGVTPALKENAKDLARHGYAAVVPNLFYRGGGVPEGASREDSEWIAGHFGDGRMRTDLEDALTFAQGLTHEVDPARAGVVGFGLGGRLALLLAARKPRAVQAAAGFDARLGTVEMADGTPRPADVLAEAGAIRCPVLACFAGKGDGVTPAADVERLRGVLGEWGEVVVLQDAATGYLDEAGPDYDEAAQRDTTKRLRDLLDTALGPDPA